LGGELGPRLDDAHGAQARAQAAEPGRCQQRGDRHRPEGGVAVPPGAIGEALGHAAGEEMQEGRAPGAERREIVAREDAEHLEQHAARPGWWKGDDAVSVERSREGPTPGRTVAGEVGPGEDTAARANGAGDRRGRRSPREGAGATTAEALEGGCEVG